MLLKYHEKNRQYLAEFFLMFLSAAEYYRGGGLGYPCVFAE